MWTQVITSSSIDYKPDGLGNYIGSGTQVYIENPNGSVTDLPLIGTDFLDIGTSITYPGIKLQSITITHNHKADGNGRMATCNYSSTEVQKPSTESDVFGSYTGNLKTVSQDSKTNGNNNWAFYRGNLLGNDAGWSADVANSSGIAGNSLQWLIPQGSFKKRYIATTDEDFNSFKSDFVNVAGKINTTAFDGFDVGNVLLTSFDAEKQFQEGSEKWFIYCNYNWQIIPEVGGQDCFQYIPSAVYDVEIFLRPVKVERSPGTGTVVTNRSLLYKYADLASFNNTWSGTTTNTTTTTTTLP